LGHPKYMLYFSPLDSKLCIIKVRVLNQHVETILALWDDVEIEAAKPHSDVDPKSMNESRPFPLNLKIEFIWSVLWLVRIFSHTEDFVDSLKPKVSVVETDVRDAKRRITLARGPAPSKPKKDQDDVNPDQSASDGDVIDDGLEDVEEDWF